MSSTHFWKNRSKANLEDMVCDFFKEEIISDFKCENCGNLGINKSHNIIHFPKYLIVLVKRFVFFPKPKKLLN